MRLKSLYTVILFLLPFAGYSQSNGFSFQKISLEEGLSQSSVSCIFQDSKGFLWFGTSNGLNKYDGYSFTVFKHDPEDSSSLSSDMIMAITEDTKGNLWVGTEEGVNLFDPVSGKSIVYRSSPSSAFEMITSLCADNSALWIGTSGDGLMKLDIKSRKIKPVPQQDKTNARYRYITSVKKDSKGNLWISSIGGLTLFNPAENKLVNIEAVQENKPVEIKNLFSLTLDEKDDVWFSSFGILNKYDPVSQTCTSFAIPFKNNEIWYGVTSILNDSYGNLWLATSGSGIWLFNKTNYSFTHITNNTLNPTSLTSNSIMALYEDRGGVIWIGTQTSGIAKYRGFTNKFAHFRHDPENKNSITNGLVYGIAEDIAGNSWIGTTEGLSKIDVHGKVTRFTRENGLSNNIITSIDADKNGNVWFSTQFGLNRYNLKTGRLTSYLADTLKKDWLYNNQLSEVLADTDGTIWIGSFTQGIMHYDPEKNKFSRYTKSGNNLISNRIMCITRGWNGTLLIGTEAGLNIFDKKSGKGIKFYKAGKSANELSNSLVLTALYDEGIIWVGTYGGGLNKIDIKNNKVYAFSEKQGMPNNVVYGILPDKSGNLWISTNKGLVKFNKQTNAIRVYDPSDGLQSYEFNSSAFYLGRSGTMYFGGVNGYNSFIPEKVIDNKNLPQVVVTSISSPHGVIKKGSFLKEASPVELSYTQNFLTFDFVSLDYTNPSRNKYAYKLEGFDKEWIQAGTRRMAIYTNLEPGEYVFRVKASNSDDVWNEKGASFSFIINPPFWATWWFYLSMFLFTAGLVVFVHKYRVRLKLRRLIELEEMRKKIADDFHDELGHKLTKISLYTELMKDNLDNAGENRESYLKKINDAANNLFDDTKDFIWSIDPVKDSLYDLAVYLKDFGDEFFDRTGIAFRVAEIPTSLSGVILPMDWKRQLILIFKEGMNNCLRHSGSKNIFLSVDFDSEEIKITLSDDGKGMIKENVNKGRGISNMKARAEKLKAHLKIDNLPTGGTTVRFAGGKFKFTEMKKHPKVTS